VLGKPWTFIGNPIMAQMIMDATQPLSDAFDMIRKAFSPTVNANKMFFYFYSIIMNYYW